MKIKRSLAILLAGLMVASTSSVAFAEPNNEDVHIDPAGEYYYYDKDDGYLKSAGANAGDYFAPGDTIYVPLNNAEISAAGLKNNDVKKYKVFADWSVGSKNVSGMEVVYKKANMPIASRQYNVSGYTGNYASLNGSYSSETAYKTKRDNLLANYAQDLFNTQNASATKTPPTTTYTVTIPATINNEVWKYLLAGAGPFTGPTEAAAKNSFETFINGKIAQAETVSDQWIDAVASKVTIPASGTTVNVDNLSVAGDSGPNIKKYCASLSAHFTDQNAFNAAVAFLKTSQKTAITTVANDLKKDAGTTASTPYTYTVSGFVAGGPFASLNNKYTSNISAADAEKKFTDAAKVLVANLHKQFNDGVSNQRPSTGYSTNTGYAWFAAITTKDNSTTKVLDLVGEIDVTKTSTAAKKYDGFELEVGLTNGLYGGGSSTSGSISIDSNTGAVVSFDRDAGDTDITWGDDLALFEVNATNQGDLNLSYNTKYIEDFADKYPNANIDFITFPAIPSFNRTGTMYLYADEDTYVYEVTNEGARKLDAVYDDTYGAWRFKTRTLSSYAISDKKLNTTTSSSSSSSAPSSTPPTSGSTGGTTGGTGGITGGGLKPNPDTGR